MSTLSTDQVWQDLSQQIHAFLLRRVGDESTAADLLQETFVRVHEGLGSLHDSTRILPWVYRIARNTLADHFRKPGRHEPLGQEPRAPELDDSNFNTEVGAWLNGMIGTLPAHYRQAVQLAEVEGLSQQSVAKRLSLSLSGAKSRIQRGRQMLKERLLACCHLEFDRHGNVVAYQQQGSCSACKGSC